MSHSPALRQTVLALTGAFWMSAAVVLVQSSQDPVKPGSGPSTLPGGASQLQETHGDWRVTCVLQSEQRVCVLSQQQADKDSRQLVLGIELKAVSPDRAEGTIVLPFGLAVARPITLQVDEGPGVTLPFRTCLPAGCLVAVTFDSTMVAALRQGTVLSIKTTAADGIQEAGFKISLKGFASALTRTVGLAK